MVSIMLITQNQTYTLLPIGSKLFTNGLVQFKFFEKPMLVESGSPLEPEVYKGSGRRKTNIILHINCISIKKIN